MTESTPKGLKECPYCDNCFDPRGLFMHIRQSNDDKHGLYGEVPDNFDRNNLKISNKDVPKKPTKSTSVKMNKHLYLCNWCNKMFKGEKGYNVHLSRSQDDGLHPEDASIEDEEYTLVPCDEDWNPLMDIDDVYDVQKNRRKDNKIGNF